MYLDTIPPQKPIFEFALRARKIAILGTLATQFHEISGLSYKTGQIINCDMQLSQ
jgi:hypothetical protein